MKSKETHLQSAKKPVISEKGGFRHSSMLDLDFFRIFFRVLKRSSGSGEWSLAAVPLWAHDISQTLEIKPSHGRTEHRACQFAPAVLQSAIYVYWRVCCRVVQSGADNQVVEIAVVCASVPQRAFPLPFFLRHIFGALWCLRKSYDSAQCTFP